MDARPEEVKRSGQGKMAAATQVSSALNLKPLFRQLRNRVSGNNDTPSCYSANDRLQSQR